MYMTWSFYRLWKGSHLIVSAENMHRWWALNITSTLWIFIKGCVISAGNVCATLRTNQHITRCLTRTFRWPASAAIFGADSSALLHVLESSWRKHFQNGRSQNMQWASYLGKKVTCVASWYSIVRLKKHISVPLLEEADEWSDSGAWANHDEGHWWIRGKPKRRVGFQTHMDLASKDIRAHLQ